MNAYEILGVDSKASQSDIRRAYQLRAQICHPDRGGDTEEFKQLREAYDILRDEERRRCYDSSDMHDGYLPESEVTEKAKAELINMFVGIAEKFDMHTDFISVIRKIIIDNLSMMSKNKAQADALSRKLKKISKRIKKKNGVLDDGIFSGALLERSRKLMVESVSINNNQRICKRVLEILDDYEYDTTREVAGNNPYLTFHKSLITHSSSV